jgi:hypothetical protein
MLQGLHQPLFCEGKGVITKTFSQAVRLGTLVFNLSFPRIGSLTVGLS